MREKLDKIIVRVGIEVNGKINVYEGLYIKATGIRFANANQNECTVEIYNLKKETQDYILSETSPFNKNRTQKKLFLDAGVESTGVTRIFSGNIVSSSPTQPPDIAVQLKCLTGNYLKGKIVSINEAPTASLKQVSGAVAKSLGVGLDFQAEDTPVSNYSYTGAASKQVNALGELGAIDVYVDNDMLVVKDARVPLTNRLTVVNENTGMIGIPETTERGVKVKLYLDGQTTVGGRLRLTSRIYPALTGDYAVFKLGFEISNFSDPFWWIIEAARI